MFHLKKEINYFYESFCLLQQYLQIKCKVENTGISSFINYLTYQIDHYPNLKDEELLSTLLAVDVQIRKQAEQELSVADVFIPFFYREQCEEDDKKEFFFSYFGCFSQHTKIDDMNLSSFLSLTGLALDQYYLWDSRITLSEDFEENFDALRERIQNPHELILVLVFLRNLSYYYDIFIHVIRAISAILHNHEHELMSIIENRMDFIAIELKNLNSNTIDSDVYVSVFSPFAVTQVCFKDSACKLSQVFYGLYATMPNQHDIENSNEEKLLGILKAVADKTRFQILKRVSDRPYFVQELADDLDLSAATVSHHLSILMQTGLVILRVDGTRAYYGFSNPQYDNFIKGLRLLFRRDT